MPVSASVLTGVAKFASGVVQEAALLPEGVGVEVVSTPTAQGEEAAGGDLGQGSGEQGGGQVAASSVKVDGGLHDFARGQREEVSGGEAIFFDDQNAGAFEVLAEGRPGEETECVAVAGLQVVKEGQVSGGGGANVREGRVHNVIHRAGDGRA